MGQDSIQKYHPFISQVAFEKDTRGIQTKKRKISSNQKYAAKIERG